MGNCGEQETNQNNVQRGIDYSIFKTVITEHLNVSVINSILIVTNFQPIITQIGNWREIHSAIKMKVLEIEKTERVDSININEHFRVHSNIQKKD